jgi:hemerythrin
MDLLQWKDEYSVGFAKIDEQHQGLFNLLNTLILQVGVETNKKLIGEAVEKLLDYTKYHFSTEEYLMRKAEYPDYEAHKAEHEKFVAKAVDFFKEFDSDKAELSEEIIVFLRDWVTNHILKTDKKYQSYLKD